jgi:NADH-quinone oxidoreductase subunit M
MGYVIVGLFSLNAMGVTGAMYQMLNHAVSTGGLFLLIGMVYERKHTRDLKEYGGIAKVMPWYAIAFMIMTLSSVALPGTNGFVGEFLILLGNWQTNPVLAAFCGLGVIFGAVYMLWLVQKMMFGPISKKENEELRDLNMREIAVMFPLVLAVFAMGVRPNFFFAKMEPSIQRFLQKAQVQSSVVAKE